MGYPGYFCTLGCIILFASLVVLMFTIAPAKEEKLDPNCYAKCRYGEPDFKKNVRKKCKLAGGLGITFGITLCIVEFILWRKDQHKRNSRRSITNENRNVYTEVVLDNTDRSRGNQDFVSRTTTVLAPPGNCVFLTCLLYTSPSPRDS